jgi:hypothetical protein
MSITSDAFGLSLAECPYPICSSLIFGNSS